MDGRVTRRRRVERQLRLIGLALLGLIVVGFVAWILLQNPNCSKVSSNTSSWDYCLCPGQPLQQALDLAGFVLLGLSVITALWWVFFKLYQYQTERLRLDSILKSHLQSGHAPSWSVEGARDTPSDVPPWRSGLKAALVVATLLSVITAVVFVVAFVEDMRRPFDPYDIRRDSNEPPPPSYFFLILFLASIGVILRIIAIRKADFTHRTRNSRIETLSKGAAYSRLQPPQPIEHPKQGLWHSASKRVLRLLRWSPPVRSRDEPSALPSTDGLRLLYAKERTKRLTAFSFLILALFLGFLSHSIYDSAECLKYHYRYSHRYCIQIDPDAVTLSRIIGVTCFLAFITGARFWWGALVLQIRTRKLETRLAEQERLREGASEGYHLEGQ